MVISQSRMAGLFAELTTTIRHLQEIKSKGKKIYVDWNKRNNLYYDENFGENVWDYFFEKIDGNYDGNVDYILNDYIQIHPENNMNIRETFNFFYKTYIKLNNNTKSIIENELKKIPNNTLGVHIRKTDKFFASSFGEPMAYPVDDDLVINLINEKIKNYDYLYLATDCSETYELFSKTFKDKLIINEKIRGIGNDSIHTSNKLNGYHKALEALIDCYCLSKCDFLIRSTSNLSSFSMFINLNLECININEIYRGDVREHDFNIYSKI
jgi:hypothetical protein